MEEAEREASPERFGGQQPWRERHEQLERAETRHTSSSRSSSSGGSVRMQEIGMERMETQHEADFDLERHPTALSRIQTARSQHSATVGAQVSRRSTKQSKPLPNFGGGKPYPPALPEREEYVVEFDGPDDPMHAQNWPNRKK